MPRSYANRSSLFRELKISAVIGTHEFQTSYRLRTKASAANSTVQSARKIWFHVVNLERNSELDNSFEPFQLLTRFFFV